MSYRDTVAAVNGFQLRKHGHSTSMVGADLSSNPVPTRDPQVSKQILASARNDLMLERNKYLLELNGILPGSARQDVGLEDKIKLLLQQRSDLGSIDPNDPVAKGRADSIDSLLVQASNRILVLKNLIASLDVKIKDVNDRILRIDEQKDLEELNVLARDSRKQQEAREKKAALARQQRDLEAKKNAPKVAKNVPSTPSNIVPPSAVPFGPQPPTQVTSESTEVRESGGGLGLAIGLAVVGTAIAVASQS